ncbi:uncharacterized protein LOC132058611 [Lycium ferocissimum]|uniref:uncharacterized protein LOC132058611 n=1 Tax=Lycium ferocissimum TaxID=112874 RepID=UPI002814F4D8|nr:uncharacterized protein LOC132058611 [Lycium ferocissimum]
MAEIVARKDRISELPVHIIHDILRRIRQNGLDEETRTRVLSKRWNLIWRTRPDLIFQSSHYSLFTNLEDFVKFVDDSLQPYVKQNLSIEMLRLTQLHPRELPCHSHVDRWLELAIKLHVRFLEIDAAWFGSSYYSIPDSIYAAKTLTVLYLSGCNFGIDNNSTNKLQGLFSTCSLIRDLKLSRCMGFKNLHVLGLLYLENLELTRCKKLEKVEIWAPNLKQFVYAGMPLEEYPRTLEPELLPCTIDILDGHKTLEYLHLEATTMADQQFEYQLSMFPALEVLELTGCYVMKNIKVVSEKLKRFTLWHWQDLEQVNVLAPNLMAFYFEGCKMPFSISTMDLSNLECGRLDLSLQPSDSYNFGDVDTSWYKNLLCFVQKFNYSNGLKLVFHCEESILIYEAPRAILLPPTRKLDLYLESPTTRLESFVNDMMFAQPKIISIVHGIDSKILQILHEMTAAYTKKQNIRLKEVTNYKGAAEDGVQLVSVLPLKIFLDLGIKG